MGVLDPFGGRSNHGSAPDGGIGVGMTGIAFGKKNPGMKLLQQVHNLKILHDDKGSGNVFVKAPDGRFLEEFKTMIGPTS